MKYASITATGSYLPEKKLSNTELESIVDTSDEWIYARTGIKSRHIARDDETTADMAVKAAKDALDNSKLLPDDIDLIIVATCTANFTFPSVACQVLSQLEINRHIPAFDISAACSGFIYALDMAKQYILSGSMQHVLVIGSEKMSSAINWEDRSTCILFGDGSGAAIVSASEKPGILGSVCHAKYDNQLLLNYKNRHSSAPMSYIEMKGNEVFKLAVNIMNDVVDEVLDICQLEKKDIQWLLPHQANIRIIQAIAKKLQLPMSQVIVTIEAQGNTSAASIPIALDHCIKSQQIKSGDKLLLESFGGGLTWGALVLQY